MNVRLDDYLSSMRAQVERLASRSERPHPFLGRDDLEQEALIALWRVWQQWHKRVSEDSMQRIGSKAIRAKVIDQYRYAYWPKRGADCTVNLEPEMMEWIWAHMIGDDGMLDLLAQLMGEPLLVYLSADAERLLTEFTRPRVRFQRLLRRLWRTKPKHWSWPRVETAALAQLLGWTPARVLRSRAELRHTLEWFLGLNHTKNKR